MFNHPVEKQLCEGEEEELGCVCMEKPPNNTLLCKHKICPECMGKLHANECPQC